jgi:hypothetical protein
MYYLCLLYLDSYLWHARCFGWVVQGFGNEPEPKSKYHEVTDKHQNKLSEFKLMIIKPAISWLTNDNDALLLNDCSVILTALADNKNIYANPTPDLASIQTALDNFSDGVSASAIGGQADTIKKNNLRLVLVALMRQLAAYVGVACKGNMENLVLSGFPVQKPVRQPIGPLPQPQGLTVTHGDQRGQLAGKVNPVFGAVIYNWRCTPATPGATAVVEQDTAASHTFEALSAGVNYTIDVNAAGSAGVSDWSNPASLTAD